MIGQNSSDIGRSEKIASTAFAAGTEPECGAWTCAVAGKICKSSKSARTGESKF
jgi:hypothetical protein